VTTEDSSKLKKDMEKVTVNEYLPTGDQLAYSSSEPPTLVREIPPTKELKIEPWWGFPLLAVEIRGTQH